MIISHKHNYLFIETPLTATTAISIELVENYNGERILHKHSNYVNFKKSLKIEENYFVFAGVRNPLDEVVSRYTKFLTDHKGRYTNDIRLLKHGGTVTNKEINIYDFIRKKNSFSAFFNKFYKFPFTSNININKKYCSYIYKFENLQEDFSTILELLDIKQIRPLPKKNVTHKKKPYENYYTDDIINHALNIFGPFMKEWNYEFPKHFPRKNVTNLNQKNII